MNGIHAAFTGRIGKDAECAPLATANPGHPSPWQALGYPVDCLGDILSGVQQFPATAV
jgi:hypothetical protein